jgi:O-antigen/teichoic acid export membrane protein
MNQLKIGAFLSYLNLFISNIFGILLTPFIIICLGDADYGLYTTMGALVIYFSILDFGLKNTVFRFVSLYQLEKNQEKEKEFLSTTLFISIIIMLLMGVLGIILYFQLDNLYKNSFTTLELIKAKKMYILLVLSLMVGFPGNVIFGICNGYQEFVFSRLSLIIRYLTRAILIIILLRYNGDSLSLVWVDFLMNFIHIIISFIFVIYKLKIDFSVKFINSKIIKEIFAYSIWVFIVVIISRTQWLSGQFLLGITTNTTTVAYYGIAVLLGTYYTLFASTFQELLFPKATEFNSKKLNGEQLTYQIIKIARLIFYILLPILIGFYFFGEEFLTLWIDENYLKSWTITFLIMLTLTIPLTLEFGISIIQAQNNLKKFSIFNLVILMFFVILGYFLSYDYGSTGYIICILISIIISTIVNVILFKKIFDFKIYYFFKEVFFKNIITIFIILIAGYFINKLFININWFVFISKLLILSILYFTTLYFFSLNNEEKNIINKIVSKFYVILPIKKNKK